MSFTEDGKKCFTFTWILENISYSLKKKGECVESPEFVVDDIQGTKWNLMLFPRGGEDGNYIDIFLKRIFDSKGEDDEVEFFYELAFVDESGLNLIKQDPILTCFYKDSLHGAACFAKREDIFIFKRSEYLPEDTLTARCRIWKKCGCVTENVRCLARTRIAVEKRSFFWNLENFSDLEPEMEYIYKIKSVQKRSELMSVNLYLTGGQNCEEIIHFKLICLDESIEYCVLRLSLVKDDGSKLLCNEDEFWFDKLCATQRFTLCLSRQKLNAMACFSDDILSLHWECSFSKGIVSEEIVKVECDNIFTDFNFLMTENKQEKCTNTDAESL